MASKKLKVVKTNLPTEIKNRDIPKAFPKMPILYLELLENKSKIKPELVNKEYIPKSAVLEFHDGNDVKEDYENISESEPENYKRHDNDNTSDEDTDKRNREELKRRRVESDEERQSDDDYDEPKRRSDDYDEEKRRRNTVTEEQQRRSDNDQKRRSDYESDDDYRPKDRDNYSPSNSNSSPALSDTKSVEEDAGQKIQNRLKELLGDSDDDDKRRDRRRDDYRDREQDRDRERDRDRQRRRDDYTAPSLADLQKSGKFYQKKELEDVGHVTTSEQEQEDAKRELLFKFELLKKSYKTANVPEFTVHSDYDTMRKSYESTLRTLSLDKTVEDYKRYLIGGFMLMEFVLGNWMNFDMQGFTQQQIISMNSYERLLLELGEKSYVPSGSKWPVELRLLFLVVMNAAFFIISKMILKKTGSNLMGMINNMNAAAPSASSSTASAGGNPMRTKRKMKGPSVSVDDIPDLETASVS